MTTVVTAQIFGTVQLLKYCRVPKLIGKGVVIFYSEVHTLYVVQVRVSRRIRNYTCLRVPENSAGGLIGNELGGLNS